MELWQARGNTYIGPGVRCPYCGKTGGPTGHIHRAKYVKQKTITEG